MNILIIGTAASHNINNHKEVTEAEGDLYIELSKHFDAVDIYQFVNRNPKYSYRQHKNLSHYQSINLIGPSIKKHSVLEKLFAYFKTMLFAPLEIIKHDWVHIFLPGNVSLIVGLIARLMGVKYSFYLRGDITRHAGLYERIISHAQFGLVTGSYFCEKYKSYCSNIFPIIPMIKVSKEDLFFERKIKTPVPIRLLFVGVVTEKKGVNELLQVFELLREKSKLDVCLDVVGGIEDTFIIESIKPPLRKHIHLHGPISDNNQLLSLYREADIFIFPSHSEGFPRVLYEAMTAGLPIATTFVGSVSSIMKDQINCLEIPAKDVDGQYKIIEGMILDHSIREKISIGGLNTMKDYLDSINETPVEQLWSLINTYKKKIK